MEEGVFSTDVDMKAEIEGFMNHRMFLRVLLVETDDSTRQIIAALLRRCSYKVVAVSDGVKAWEILNDKVHCIDLVLTEVDLPSISGFCLLTMITEHDTCKNLPVIMMSSQDSLSMVYKCMLKGAADFLVKPVRKNELRNLWQHVWRRQNAKCVRQVQQAGNPPQRKLDAGSENDVASNHSSDSVSCMQKNRESSENGSDSQNECMKISSPIVQSICTKLDMESGHPYVYTMQEPFQSKYQSPSNANEVEMQKCEEDSISDCVLLMPEIMDKDKSTRLRFEVTPTNKAISSSDTVQKTFHNGSSDEYIEKLHGSCREAIDLIGVIDNQPHHSYEQTLSYTQSSEDIVNPPDAKDNLCRFSSESFLELSLKRSLPSGSENYEIEEMRTLNHSSASAFSQYIKILQSGHPQASSSTIELRETASCSKPLSNQGPGNAQDTPHLGNFPIPVPVKIAGYEGLCSDYDSFRQPSSYRQSGLPLWTMNASNQQEGIHENSSHESDQDIHNHNNHLCDQSSSQPMNQAVPESELLESTENPVPTVSGQSGSSLCNGSKNYLDINGYGSVCNGSNSNSIASVSAVESGADKGPFTNDGLRVVDYMKLSQREAALNKFRLKRKDRCFEKKVRYQSRKRLAEQRPRIKGQFVRQLQSDS